MQNSRAFGIMSWLAALLLAISFAASNASAQCFTPDNLDGTCCDDAVANLPVFPDLNLTTKYMCFTDCTPGFNADLPVKTIHQPVGCGLALIRFDITNSGGALTIWKGKLIASYSRTWAERSPGSTAPDTQVYRFLVNGDFVIDPFVVTTYGANQCIVPPSYTTFGKILVTGYVDYAFDCITNTWSMSFAFGHECDVFEHDNPFSARPGSFGNLGRSYNWVGPAAGFVIDSGIPTASGDLMNEGIRNNDFTMPLSMICETEQPVVQGSFITTGGDCPCKNGPAVNQWTISRLSAVTACGSNFFNVPIGIAPWDGFLSKSVGRWTDPGTYPGAETVHTQQGFIDYTDACGSPMNRYYVKGAHTQGGWDTSRFVGAALVPVTNRFIDLGTAIPLSGAVNMPAVGRRYISDRMMCFNVEF